MSARKYEVSFRAELTDRQVEALADTLFEMGYDDLCFRPLPTLDFEDAVVRAHHSRADTTADRDALRDALQHETQRGLKW